jgi:hypothetical protein
MAQAVSYRPLTAETGIRSLVYVRFAVNEPSIAETGFSPDFSGYPVIIILS